MSKINLKCGKNGYNLLGNGKIFFLLNLKFLRFFQIFKNERGQPEHVTSVARALAIGTMVLLGKSTSVPSVKAQRRDMCD